MKNSNNKKTESSLIIKIDDYLKDIYKIAKLIKKFEKQGTKNFILTPTLVIDNDVYEQQKTIEGQFLKLKSILQESKQQIVLGYRIIGSDRLVQINQYNQFTIGHSNIVMVEAGEYDNLEWISDLMYELKLQKIQLMLAQVERYEYFMKRPEELQELIQQGMTTEVNTESILGEQGHQIKTWTKNIIKENWVNCLSIYLDLKKKEEMQINMVIMQLNKWCKKENKQKILYRNAQELFIDINY